MATESKVLSHFEVSEAPLDSESENYKAKCKHCSKLISGSRKTCSNFTVHLKVI